MSKPKAPKVYIQKLVYTMASVDGNAAELTMYGDIYETRPTRWNGDPVEGEFITLTEFLGDLTAIENFKDITIRIWLEGNDPECIAFGEGAVAGKSLLANISFGVDE